MTSGNRAQPVTQHELRCLGALRMEGGWTRICPHPSGKGLEEGGWATLAFSHAAGNRHNEEYERVRLGAERTGRWS